MAALTRIFRDFKKTLNDGKIVYDYEILVEHYNLFSLYHDILSLMPEGEFTDEINNINEAFDDLNEKLNYYNPKKYIKKKTAEKNKDLEEKEDDKVKKSHQYTHRLRQIFSPLNWLRLFLLRTKRLAESLNTILHHTASFYNNYYIPFINVIDKSNLVFRLLGFIFYIPRFTVNCFNAAKHIIKNLWMSDEEKGIPWYKRLIHQLQRRWFELANDGVWIIAGVLTGIFFITGIGALITTGLYLFDVINASVRHYVEMRRYEILNKHRINRINEINNIISGLPQEKINADPKKLQLKKESDLLNSKIFTDKINEHKNFHRKKSRFSVGITVGLLIGMAVMLLTPIFPPAFFIGAGIVVGTSIIQISGNQFLKRYDPKIISSKEKEVDEVMKSTTDNTSWIKINATLDIEKNNSLNELPKIGTHRIKENEYIWERAKKLSDIQKDEKISSESSKSTPEIGQHRNAYSFFYNTGQTTQDDIEQTVNNTNSTTNDKLNKV